MKAKIKNSGEIVVVERITNSTYGRIDGPAELYRKDMLDFNLDPPHPQATISGWVARDGDGTLYFYDIKPIRDPEDYDWIEQNGDAFYLHKGLDFPSLTWYDDPIEVEIQIKPKKQ